MVYNSFFPESVVNVLVLVGATISLNIVYSSPQYRYKNCRSLVATAPAL